LFVGNQQSIRAVTLNFMNLSFFLTTVVIPDIIRLVILGYDLIFLTIADS